MEPCPVLIVRLHIQAQMKSDAGGGDVACTLQAGLEQLEALPLPAEVGIVVAKSPPNSRKPETCHEYWPGKLWTSWPQTSFQAPSF